MIEKYISLLEEQILKLENKHFNLDAWKKFTIVLLERIFGENNKKIQTIENIKYDQGSWVLRDASGTSTAMDTYKKLGKEILEASIFELKNFGLHENSEIDLLFESIVEPLRDELTGSQFKEIKNIINRDISSDEKRKLLFTKIKNFGELVSVKILSNIIANPALSKAINKNDRY